MSRTLAALAALVGGLAWVAAFALEQTDRTSQADLADWVGRALLTVAMIGAGVRLVNHAPIWLRLIAGVGFGLLGWSVLAVLTDGFSSRPIEGAAGAAAVVVAAVMLSRRPPPPERPERAHASGRRRGSHAR